LEETAVTAEEPQAADWTRSVGIMRLLEQVLEEDASDLHLTAGLPPTVRVHGDLKPLSSYPKLTPEQVTQMMLSMLTQRQRERLEQDRELDASFSLPGRARFRVNGYYQRDSMGAAFRLIPTAIRSVEELGLPPNVADLARLPRGLVLVTGPTGSGKSTSLAAMLNVINTERACHIMTIEDPIEYLHMHKVAMVNQREVGADTQSFAEALRHVLRQDPDVILVGEMRDLETIQTTLTAAETGHLAFATLHTQDAPQTIDRIIDAFPSGQQQQVRVQLSTTLQGVVTQQLIPTADGRGRVVAAEVMIATPAIRNLIREAKVHQVYSAMQAGGNFGMRTMDQALAHLVKTGQITYVMAQQRCHDPEELTRLVGSGATSIHAPAGDGNGMGRMSHA